MIVACISENFVSLQHHEKRNNVNRGVADGNDHHGAEDGSQWHEVLVMADNPHELVMAAIGRIGANYSPRPELYHCFYRETAMKRQHYISVAEGVVTMYKTGVEAGAVRDRVAIQKGRRLLSAKQGDTLGVKVQGGPVTAVQLDVVKNRDFLLNADGLNRTHAPGCGSPARGARRSSCGS